jgi:hypothetical protein
VLRRTAVDRVGCAERSDIADSVVSRCRAERRPVCNISCVVVLLSFHVIMRGR